MPTPRLMKVNSVKIADVDDSFRLRPVSEAGVESLIASIEETGVMKDAIHVRQKKGGKLVLIAGGHRLEAGRRLGWEEIEAKVWADVTDDWARLMEIDDNLAGAEMNALDTAVFLAERKRVYEKLHPEAKQGGDRRSVEFQTDMKSVWSFATTTAEKFGITERHVRRMVAAGTSLAPDEVSRLRRAPKPVLMADLQVIGKLGPAERYKVVEALAEGKVRSAAQALQAVASPTVQVKEIDANEAAYQKIAEVWTRTPAVARRRFLADFGDDVVRFLPDAKDDVA